MRTVKPNPLEKNHTPMTLESISVDPTTLPTDHELRNTPLKQIGAWVRNNQGSRWQDLRDMRIGNCTFNELGSVWTDCNQWKIVL